MCDALNQFVAHQPNHCLCVCEHFFVVNNLKPRKSGGKNENEQILYKMAVHDSILDELFPVHLKLTTLS